MLKCFTGKKNRERMAPGKMKDYTGGLIQLSGRFTTVGFIIGSLYSFTCVSRSKR